MAKKNEDESTMEDAFDLDESFNISKQQFEEEISEEEKQRLLRDVQRQRSNRQLELEEFQEKLDEGVLFGKGQLAREGRAEVAKGLSKLSTTKSAKAIDPLKGLRPRATGKRGPGRPRKYAKKPKSMKPVGRPPKKTISLGGESIYESRSRGPVQREPYVPPTREQALMMKFLGNKNQVWGFGGSPVRVTGRLNTGMGLIKNGDRGQTAYIFGGLRR